MVSSAVAAQKDKLLPFLLSQVKDTKHLGRTLLAGLSRASGPGVGTVSEGNYNDDSVDDGSFI